MQAQEIRQEIARLGCSTEEDSYSGLSIEDDEQGIKVFDDYVSGIYDPQKLLDLLKACECADLERDSQNNIWQVIKPADTGY